MATAFENLAPRIMRDLIQDLDLTPAQAAGIVGNLAAESGLLAIQEKRPIRGRGGFGWAQWTGSRRLAFEKWAKGWGHELTSYAANYGFLLSELKNSYAYVIDRLRLTTTAKAAAETFGYHFERFKGFETIGGNPNYATRVRFAERALALYQKAERVVVPPPPVTPVPLPEPVRPGETKRIQGLAVAALGLLGGAIAKKWFPGSENALTSFLVDYGGEITAAAGVVWSWLGQKNATAPITNTPLAESVSAARRTVEQAAVATQTESDRADAAEAIPAAPQSLFDLPMSVVLDELPALIRAINTVAAEQPKLLEHRPPEFPDKSLSTPSRE